MTDLNSIFLSFPQNLSIQILHTFTSYLRLKYLRFATPYDNP